MGEFVEPRGRTIGRMIRVPERLAAAHRDHGTEASRAFIAGLPARAEEFLERWELTPAGEPMHGVVALVLPVVRSDGTESVLKLQPVDDETAGEPVALRAWDGAGAVRLLDHDPATGTLLLERLDAARPLSAVADTGEAVRILGTLLAGLTLLPAPAGLRRLGDVTAAMLEQVPGALSTLVAEDERRLLADCAAAVREVAGEPGDRLLHWDLHYDNVLGSAREPWLAIDPKPLAGDPGFELLPALTNRFDPDPAAIRWRFDLLTEAMGMEGDRERARAWTLGRVLQFCLWDVADGAEELDEIPVAIANALLRR
ncbi:aminoglycoside phosphotransferase family protein [Streptomyces tsukubensis]|uniref:aminoglycoside phosphotransferase family protein n=1 Tax=Streptomyces tsukubensis TaxID=83656 RepID=UPI003697F73A